MKNNTYTTKITVIGEVVNGESITKDVRFEHAINGEPVPEEDPKGKVKKFKAEWLQAEK